MLGGLAVLSALQGLQAQTPGLSYPVPLDEAHFPDKAFREFLWYNIDENEDGQLSVEECGAVEEIEIFSYYKDVTSLEGIEYFYTLTTLRCSNTQLTSLNLSKNTALTYLECSITQLTSLNLSQNTALTNLNCSGNQLTSLDLSQNTTLTNLNCSGNQLTSLNLSRNTTLETLYCDDNQLTSLDVSGCTALTDLSCGNNQLTSLDLSRNTALTTLRCSNTRLTTLDLSRNTALTFLDYSYNDQLTSLDLSKRTSLTGLVCSGNQLTSLDLSKYTSLTYLNCSDNQLTSLDISQKTALELLYCSDNDLTSLDLSRNTALTYLDCSGNDLTSLDLSRNTNLIDLDCSDNHLAALDLSQNGNLLSVNAERNYYEVSLDEGGNVDIAAIPGLEADRMTDLQGGHIGGNTLHLDAEVLMYYYDYKRPNYYAPSGGYFYIATDNPAYHIPIDKEHFPDTAFRKYVTASFDRDEDGQLSSVEISVVTDISIFDNERWKIHDLRGIEYFTFLQSISFYDNQLTSLDLSGCTALTSLDLSGCTALTSLDLSGCTALPSLDCSGYDLTNLDLSGCTALWTLDCSNNALLDLNVRSLSALQELDCSKNQLASLDLFRNANLVSVKADSNYREVIVNQDRQFDISTLPRFERARMEAIEGGTLQGDILTFEQDEVRYFYSYNNADPNLPLGEYFHLKAVQAPVPGIAINDTTFPDAVFRGYIAENADTDKDGLLSESEIAGVTGIDVSGMGIQNLRGIKYFTALESLDCSDNALTSLDLSANTALQTLNAGGNRLDIVLDEDNTFDVSSLPGFEMAKASNWTGCTRMGNRLTFTQQEVTYNYATGYSGSAEDASLQSVVFSLLADRDPSVTPERIVSIDEEHFPDSVFREYITAADLDTDHWLDEDEIAGVTGIDVSGMGIQDLRGIGYFTALESLDCSDNALTSLDLSANTALQTLNASGNRLDIVLDESNAFDVSSLPGFNMAKASDWTGCTRMGNKLTFTQQEVTYAYATGYSGSAEDASLKSVTFSLMADRDPSMGNETSDLQPQGRVYAKDRTLYTEGISGEVSVFTAVGTLVYQGKDTRIPVHQAGTYIVRHGEQVWKILVM